MVIGAPVLFAVVWGTFLASNSSLRLGESWLFLIELVIFALAGWALYRTCKVNLAASFGVIYILKKILMVI